MECSLVQRSGGCSWTATRQNPHVLLTFGKVQNPLCLPRKTTAPNPFDFFSLLTSKCASRHNIVHFFNIATSKKCSGAEVLCTFWLRNVRATTAYTLNIWTSKSALNVVCFVHFDFQMCFAPTSQLQKGLRTRQLFTFWLRNVFCATTACTCSTAQLPKVFRTCGVLNFFTCKCASCHNGVQLFISHLTKWLRTRRFSEPTFRPSGATNH